MNAQQGSGGGIRRESLMHPHTTISLMSKFIFAWMHKVVRPQIRQWGWVGGELSVFPNPKTNLYEHKCVKMDKKRSCLLYVCGTVTLARPYKIVSPVKVIVTTENGQKMAPFMLYDY